jgi:hypothetical protein
MGRHSADSATIPFERPKRNAIHWKLGLGVGLVVGCVVWIGASQMVRSINAPKTVSRTVTLIPAPIVVTRTATLRATRTIPAPTIYVHVTAPPRTILRTTRATVTETATATATVTETADWMPPIE